MTHINIQIFLKISLAITVEIVYLALRTVIDSFQIYAINSSNEKKSLETNLIMSKVSFRVAQPKKTIIISEGSTR